MSDENPVVPIRLGREIVSDLTLLIQHRDQIDRIVDAAKDVPPASSIRAFSSRVAKRIDDAKVDTGVVLDVLQTLVNIPRMARRLGVERGRMIGVLTASLSRYSDEKWKERHLDGWESTSSIVASAIKSIHEGHPLFISAKAETLAYSHQNILTSQRIITDVRPVFDRDGAKIEETLILHNLLVEYSDGISPPKRVCFTLDSDDVTALRKSCERAEGKARSTREALKGLNPIDLSEASEN